jgi:hypothetical protein
MKNPEPVPSEGKKFKKKENKARKVKVGRGGSPATPTFSH